MLALAQSSQHSTLSQKKPLPFHFYYCYSIVDCSHACKYTFFFPRQVPITIFPFGFEYLIGFFFFLNPSSFYFIFFLSCTSLFYRPSLLTFFNSLDCYFSMFPVSIQHSGFMSLCLCPSLIF